MSLTNFRLRQSPRNRAIRLIWLIEFLIAVACFLGIYSFMNFFISCCDCLQFSFSFSISSIKNFFSTCIEQLIIEILPYFSMTVRFFCCLSLLQSRLYNHMWMSRVFYQGLFFLRQKHCFNFTNKKLYNNNIFISEMSISKCVCVTCDQGPWLLKVWKSQKKSWKSL